MIAVPLINAKYSFINNGSNHFGTIFLADYFGFSAVYEKQSSQTLQQIAERQAGGWKAFAETQTKAENDFH